MVGASGVHDVLKSISIKRKKQNPQKLRISINSIEEESKASAESPALTIQSNESVKESSEEDTDRSLPSDLEYYDKEAPIHAKDQAYHAAAAGNFHL